MGRRILITGVSGQWGTQLARALETDPEFEFICGPQEGRAVLVEYAASGVLRGLELR